MISKNSLKLSQNSHLSDSPPELERVGFGSPVPIYSTFQFTQGIDTSSNEKLQLLLRTNQLLDHSNDILIKQYMQPIVELFGGYKSVLYQLAKLADNSKIKEMHSKIKALRINHSIQIHNLRIQKQEIITTLRNYQMN